MLIHTCVFISTIDFHLSKLTGTWVCPDNQKAWTIEDHTQPTFYYSNKTHTSKNTLIEKSLLSLDKPSGWILEVWISGSPLYA